MKWRYFLMKDETILTSALKDVNLSFGVVHMDQDWPDDQFEVSAVA